MKKKLTKILLLSVFALGLVLALVVSFTIGWRPLLGPRKRALTNRQYARTPASLARGNYLVNTMLHCGDCHSPRDWSQAGGPVIAATTLSGQVLAGGDSGFPGLLVAPNITSDAETGIGRWTDDQIGRAIREGIRDDESMLFPGMPYGEYKTLSDDDVAAIVVYLRTVAPVHKTQPPTTVKFPVNYLVRSEPEPITAPVPAPDPSDPVARGKYIVSAGCGCHNPTGKSFSGGDHLKGPWGDVTSANLTPDPSGINYYSEATFITALRTGYVGARPLNPIMPYGFFKNLTDDDLKAIFAYLRTLPPVRHRVDNTLPATYCKVCKHNHGGGDQN